MIYLLIKTNCNLSVQGQIIKVSLHKSHKEAESAGKKSDFGEMIIDNISGWCNDKEKMFYYILERKL